MATINPVILDAALKDGLIPKKLSPSQIAYVNPSIIQANRIYWAIANDFGVDIEQLENRLALHPNTIKIYTRWLMNADLIYLEKHPETERHLFYSSSWSKILGVRNQQ